MKSGWLKENTAPMIALGYTSFSFIIYFLVLMRAISATENIAFLIINSITNIAMIIVGYHFGSSAGSKAKQDSLDKINENTMTTSATTTTTNSKTNENPNNISGN